MTQEQYKELWNKKSNPEVYKLLWIESVNANGHAGILDDGTIVDRRYFPDAEPFQKSSVFEAKTFTNIKVNSDIILPKVISLKWAGRGDFNRPIFKTVNKIDGVYEYYGSTRILIGDKGLDSAYKLINYFEENNNELSYFGTKFNCIPVEVYLPDIIFKFVK